MIDFTTFTDAELAEHQVAVSEEMQRRYDVRNIPQQITQLATQGRELGVTDSVMVDAITAELTTESATQ